MNILTRDDENQELEFGLYRQEGGSKKPVSKVGLSYTDEGVISASVNPYDGDAEQTRDIILGAMAKISNDINDEIFKRFSTLKPALFERLREAGYLAEELQADAKFNIQFDLRSGEVLGSHEAITPFGENQDEVNAAVFRAVSEIFTRIPNDLASSIEEARRSGGQAAALACMRAAEKQGAAHFPPTEKLYSSVFKIEIEGLSREDELYLRRWRISSAEGVGRQQEASEEAEVLLSTFGSEVSTRHAVELKLIMAASYFSLGRREAALDLWRGLADNPDELTSEQRGVVWWGISYFHPIDSEKSRLAAKLSADAYIEAGNRDHATRSLIRLADGLLHEEPLKAIESLEAITPLITEQSLGDRNLTAALLHAKANRLAKLGAHVEAADLALQAADKRRGLFGAEDEFVSSLMFASIQFDEAGDAATAKEIRAEADAFVDAHKPAHFLVAREIEELFNDYDEQKAQQIIADARSQDKADIVAYVLVARAIRSANIADSKRLAVLEEALGVMENARISDYRKQPVLAAIVTQLRNLGSEERAEQWLRRMLDTDPFDLHALSTILDSYKRRQMWGDAANVLERQIKLRGWIPQMSMEFGKCLFSAGDYSRAIDAFSHVVLNPLDESQRQEARDLREKAVERGGRPSQQTTELSPESPLTRDEFERALLDFALFISADQRMSFWKSVKVDGKPAYKWTDHPERRGQDLLHTFLKARFSDRINIFEELNTGAGRLDIYVQLYGGLSFILELKMCGGGYSHNYAAAGETQLVHYMRNRRSHLGYLIVFDARVRDFGKKHLEVTSGDTVLEYFVDVRTSVKDA